MYKGNLLQMHLSTNAYKWVMEVMSLPTKCIVVRPLDIIKKAVPVWALHRRVLIFLPEAE